MIRRLPSVVALILTAGTAGLVTGTASHAAQATLGCPGTVQTGEQLATGITVDVGTTPLGAYSLTVTYDPTVLTDIPEDASLLREEIFGPVAPVKGFASEDEAIAAANDTEFGLVAYVYTRDLKRALRVVERLETGMVGLNQGMVSNPAAPFGGIKQSGFGREGGYEGI